MNITFEQPAMLLVAVLAIPFAIIGWRALGRLDGLRRSIVVVLRSVLIATLAIVLAQPVTRQEHDHLSVIAVLDISGSVRSLVELSEDEELGTNQQRLARWLQDATADRRPVDRFGLIAFDGEPIVVATPSADPALDFEMDIDRIDGTDVEAAVRMAVAMLPTDTARRLLLVSDGRETQGDALRAVRETAAAQQIPIDVLPLRYEVDREIRIDRIEAPPRAQPGQTINVRIIIESTHAARGEIELRREDAIVDLNGADAGVTRPIDVPAGRSVHVLAVPLAPFPINRFDARFIPADNNDDRFDDNNRGQAVVASPVRGEVLIVTDRPAEHPLADLLRDADLPLTFTTPNALPADLLSLQNHDLVILDDIAASRIPREMQTMLAQYVNDLGGGLVMIGGPSSFGAGGWNGSPLEAVLPVELDPTTQIRVPSAALVLVLDRSGSMNQRVAGARASQQEVANEAAALAIESLRRDSLVGVVTFDSFSHTLVPLQPNTDPARITQRVRAIRADGGTNLAPALDRAASMLRGVEATRKHVVCLSDGQSTNTERLGPIVRRMRNEDVTVTTIAIGDDADHETLQRLAGLGDGEFHAVRDPRTLPRVLVDSVQILNKPLIKEGTFRPQPTGASTSLSVALRNAPPLEGLVVTAARPESTVVVELVHPDGEPLLAHWYSGLGRTAVFTSDLGGPWTARWTGWSGLGPFWAQLLRSVARPVLREGAELRVVPVDGGLQVSLDASSVPDIDYQELIVEGTVYTPRGVSRPLVLRQTTPGRFEADVRGDGPGNYVVALGPRQGDRRLTPVVGGATVVSSREFRAARSDAALLDEIMRLTDGRPLQFDDPLAVDLYDRAGMPTTVSRLPAWRGWLLLAIVLLMADIAARRFAWTTAGIERGLRQATATTPAVRTRSGLLRAAAERRRADEPEPLERIAPTPRPTASPEEATRSDDTGAAAEPERDVKTDAPDPESVRAGLDALLGRDKRRRPPR